MKEWGKFPHSSKFNFCFSFLIKLFSKKLGLCHNNFDFTLIHLSFLHTHDELNIAFFSRIH